MENSVNLVSNMVIMIGATALFGFGLGRCLLRNRGQLQYWETATNLLVSLKLGFASLIRLGLLPSSWYLGAWAFPMELAIGPCFALFLTCHVEPAFRFRWRHMAFFVPTLAAVAILVPPLAAGSPSPMTRDESLLAGAWLGLSLLFFLVRSVIGMWKGWFILDRKRVLTTIFGGVWTLWALWYVILLAFLPKTSPFPLVAFASLLFFPFILFYFRYLEDRSDLQKSNDRPGYQKSRIAGVDVSRVMQDLAYLMETRHLYKRDSLTLSDLGHELGITPHQLSEILNRVLGTTFKAYINRWRIEASQRLLVKHPDMSVIDVAFRSGFRSKSAFHAHFIQVNGMTPSEYRQQAAQKVPETSTTDNEPESCLQKRSG